MPPLSAEQPDALHAIDRPTIYNAVEGQFTDFFRPYEVHVYAEAAPPPR